jgi:hypothetical protein
MPSAGHIGPFGVLLTMLLSGCATLPPMTLLGDKQEAAPSGPKVAAITANLKCELWDATNSKRLLKFYKDDPKLTTKNHQPAESSRAFTLANMFGEIEYVGQALWTLDVTHTGALSPALSLSKYYNGGVGDLPATGANLSVNAGFSEAAHRYISFDSSIDLSRLVPTEPSPFMVPPDSTGKRADDTPLAEKPSPCDDGLELGGKLGLEETLVDGLQAAAMNDIAVFPGEGSNIASINVAGVTPVISLPNTFTFGQISTQIDFTIIESAGGGPTWTLKYAKFPGQGSSGLFGLQRQVKDTVVLTFVPVCIREKYWTNSTGPRFDYSPDPVDGTPGWANYLPPCASPTHLQDRVNAIVRASTYNAQTLLQNSFFQR